MQLTKYCNFVNNLCYVSKIHTFLCICILLQDTVLKFHAINLMKFMHSQKYDDISYTLSKYTYTVYARAYLYCW